MAKPRLLQSTAFTCTASSRELLQHGSRRALVMVRASLSHMLSMERSSLKDLVRKSISTLPLIMSCCTNTFCGSLPQVLRQSALTRRRGYSSDPELRSRKLWSCSWLRRHELSYSQTFKMLEWIHCSLVSSKLSRILRRSGQRSCLTCYRRTS